MWSMRSSADDSRIAIAWPWAALPDRGLVATLPGPVRPRDRVFLFHYSHHHDEFFMFNKPKVGEKIILIGCDGERCESTIVEICKPDAFSLFVVQDGDGIRFWVNSMERLPCGCVISHEWSMAIGKSAEKIGRFAIDTFSVRNDVTVGELIRKLKQLDERQKFRVQAILPDGSAFNASAKIGEIPGSNCGEGWPYVFLSIRCDGGEK